MPAFSTMLGATVLGVGGAYALGSALSSSGGKSSSYSSPGVTSPAIPAIPAAPTPEGASESAKAATEKMKRMRALAGGKTLLASAGPALSSTTGSKSLLGS